MHPLQPKWLHSVVDEPDFTTEWEAIQNAHNLAFELQTPAGTGQPHQRLNVHKDKSTCKVNFDSIVDVHVEIISPSLFVNLLADLDNPREVLNMVQLLSGSPIAAPYFPGSFVPITSSLRSCTVRQLDCTKPASDTCTVSDSVHPFPSHTSDQVVQDDVFPWNMHLQLDHVCPPPSKVNVIASGFGPRPKQIETIACDTVADQVLNSSGIAPFTLEHIQGRREFESPIDDYVPQDIPTDDDEDDGDFHDDPNHPPIPAYGRRLFNILRQEDMDPNDPNFDINI